MYSRQQGVRSAVEKFQADVPAHISQKAVVAHAEAILGVIAAGIPCINGSHGAGIGGDERGKREDAMAIVAAT
jgi:hypothetical protein